MVQWTVQLDMWEERHCTRRQRLGSIYFYFTQNDRQSWLHGWRLEKML